jgi:Tol biopolymer transport system component
MFATAASAQPRDTIGNAVYKIVDPTATILIPPTKADNANINFSTQFQGARLIHDTLYDSRERHLKNIRQLTFEGENAEAYFSPDEKHLVFQARGKNGGCDQIYMMTTLGKNVKRISNGMGRTTCGYFLPDGARILYASTYEFHNGECPAEPDKSKGYVWPLYKTFDIFISDTNGAVISRITRDSTYYDAEATVSPVGDRIVFTSTMNGDIDLYSLKVDGSNEFTRLTDEPGYDGGAFYSKDGSKIVYRASRPTGKDLEAYRSLLNEGLVKPSALEIWVMDADGKNKKQVTNNGKANFAPFFHPDGKRIIFSSNMDDPSGREFDLYMIGIDGKGLERITYKGGFDGFPMFSRDGKTLVFCSNRNPSHPHNTNIFLAEWVE